MRLILPSVLVVSLLAAPAAARQSAAGQSVNDAQYYFILGRHLEGEGKIDEAIAAHKRAIALDPRSAELHAELAALYARQDKAVEAVAEAEAALARDAGNGEANRIIGTVYAEYAERNTPLKAGDDVSTYLKRAIAAFEKALEDGSDISVDYMLGRLYLQTGAFTKSIPLLKRVADSQPGLVEAAVLLS
ncbi:MAG TPA: tetratricopeptide repeat protein, partial [Vicinamibacterales bacterium]|nr:tetratricopeptide repeat protein [Vicinamibacterales bacterium]